MLGVDRRVIAQQAQELNRARGLEPVAVLAGNRPMHRGFVIDDMESAERHIRGCSALRPWARRSAAAEYRPPRYHSTKQPC